MKKSVLETNSEPLIYCRKCMESKKSIEFYGATDLFLDSNSKMSICKSCINDIYNGFYNSSHSVDDAILKTCRVLNVIYIQSSVDALKTHIENKITDGKESGNVFGVYKRLLSPHSRGQQYTGAEDLTFVEPNVSVIENMQDFSIGNEETMEELKQSWGDGLTIDDYQFLESELADWKLTHKHDTKAEELLMKEICHKQLSIKKAREEKKSTASLVKELQDLLKTSALTPSQANAASSGHSADAFGVWIKDIEQLSPSEWWKDQTLFKDVDNIQEYAEEFIREPIRKFILGNSREYLTEISSNDNSDDGEENVQN